MPLTITLILEEPLLGAGIVRVTLTGRQLDLTDEEIMRPLFASAMADLRGPLVESLRRRAKSRRRKTRKP